MKKNLQKTMYLLIVLALMLTLTLPAFAASGQVNVTFADGTNTILVNTPDIVLHTVGATDVDTVTVGDGQIEDTYANFSKTIDKTLTNGTRYQIYKNTDPSGLRTIHFKYVNALSDDIQITVASKPVTYTTHTASGAYGQNNNYGGTATCDILAGETTIAGGEAYSAAFTPKNGQEISHFNIHVDAADGEGRLVEAKPGAVTILDQTLNITAGEGGTFTVSADSLNRNLFIVALTKDQTQKFDLAVNTDINCIADVVTETISSGSTRKVVFTPNSNYMITDLNITDGDGKAVLSMSDASVEVNGHTYKAERKLDGSLTLAVPEIKANVSVTASSSNQIHYVAVKTDNDVYSNKEGANFVTDGDRFEFYFEAKRDALLRSITIETPSRSSRTFYLDEDALTDRNGDLYYRWDGRYSDDYLYDNIRVYDADDDYVRIVVSSVEENMSFSVNSYDSEHTVTVKGDNGVNYKSSKYSVDDGDDLAITYTPTKDKYEIRRLHINYGDSFYRVSVSSDRYVRIDGNRWDIDVDSKGAVTLKMVDICEDVTVRAETNYSGSKHFSITKNQDANSVITYTGSGSYDEDDAVTVCVEARDKRILKEVSFRVGSKTVSLKPFESELVLGGKTFTVNWKSNADMSVEFNEMPGNMHITSRSAKGTIEENSNPVNQVPVHPTNPSLGANTFHTAYIRGMGNGVFAPNNTLTRAQAVTILNRAILQQQDSATASYAGNSFYTDVPAGHWAAGAINYAQSNGYLNVLGSHSLFYPDAPITRAEYLALLCNYKGVNVNGVAESTNFNDVPATHWAVKYINYCAKQGWVQGYGDNTFVPDGAVTRAEIVTMTNHILGRQVATVSAAPIFYDVPMTFWAYSEIMEAALDHYAMVGDGFETWAN